VGRKASTRGLRACIRAAPTDYQEGGRTRSSGRPADTELREGKDESLKSKWCVGGGAVGRFELVFLKKSGHKCKRTNTLEWEREGGTRRRKKM